MNPDIVPVGFAGVEGTHARLRRHRNPVLLVLSVLLAIGGIGAAIAAIVGFVAEGDDIEASAVAAGRVAALDGPATPPATFTLTAAGQHTVWVRTSGVTQGDESDNVTAATNCTAELADGTATDFRGAIQGVAATIGELSTVGTFTAPAGPVAVTCHHESFGRRQDDLYRQERDFFVVPGAPDPGWVSWALLGGGLTAIALAVPLGARWWRGGVRLG